MNIKSFNAVIFCSLQVLCLLPIFSFGSEQKFQNHTNRGLNHRNVSEQHEKNIELTEVNSNSKSSIEKVGRRIEMLNNRIENARSSYCSNMLIESCMNVAEIRSENLSTDELSMTLLTLNEYRQESWSEAIPYGIVSIAYKTNTNLKDSNLKYIQSTETNFEIASGGIILGDSATNINGLFSSRIEFYMIGGGFNFSVEKYKERIKAHEHKFGQDPKIFVYMKKGSRIINEEEGEKQDSISMRIIDHMKSQNKRFPGMKIVVLCHSWGCGEMAEVVQELKGEIEILQIVAFDGVSKPSSEIIFPVDSAIELVHFKGEVIENPCQNNPMEFLAYWAAKASNFRVQERMLENFVTIKIDACHLLSDIYFESYFMSEYYMKLLKKN